MRPKKGEERREGGKKAAAAAAQDKVSSGVQRGREIAHSNRAKPSKKYYSAKKEENNGLNSLVWFSRALKSQA